MVLALVVDHDLGDVGAQVVADHLERQVGLGVDERGGLGALGVPARDLPQLLEQAHVALELRDARALGRGAHDHARVLLRPDWPDQVAQAVALGVRQLARDADAVASGRQHHEAARERDLHREARALGSHRVLGDLHEQRPGPAG